MVAVQIEAPGTLLDHLAREAQAECNHNRQQAQALMLRWIREDPALFEQVAWYCIEESCEGAVANVDIDVRRSLRREAIRAAPDHPSQRTPVVAALPRATPAQLMEVIERQRSDPDFHQWPLPGGLPLGDATPALVLEGARFYGETERTARVNKRFLTLVHEAMQGGTCVRNVLSHAALLRLRRRAEEE